jgi:hypothetical protein
MGLDWKKLENKVFVDSLKKEMDERFSEIWVEVILGIRTRLTRIEDLLKRHGIGMEEAK